MADTLTRLLYHVVFSTKERRRLLRDDLRERLYSYMTSVISGEGGYVRAVGGTRDHVHLLFSLPPSMDLSEALRRVKGNSSKWLNKETPFGWQRGYAAFTVSESAAPAVERYIQDQERHHAQGDFTAEVRTLLKRHGVDFDECQLAD